MAEVLSGFTLALGLALGLLLGGVGLAILSRFWKVPELGLSIRVISGLATVALLAGALLGLQKAAQVPGPAWRLAVVAIFATPLIERCEGLSAWGFVLFLLPALLVVGGALLGAVVVAPASAGSSSISFWSLSAALCGGIGMRIVGEALQTVALGEPLRDWLLRGMCVALTLLVGGMGLLNLWQRGIVWRGDRVVQSGLVSAWLAWSGAWLWPHRRSRIRAGLTVAAALLLVSVVVR